MNIENSQKAMIVRYSVELMPDCIEKHKEMIEKNGYCWFGKLGVAPKPNMAEAVLDAKTPFIILYNKVGTFLCEINDIKYEKPNTGYPEYYEEYLYSKNNVPTVYFKLISIKQIELKDYTYLRVVSSKRNIYELLSGHAMSSYFFIERE